MQKSLKLTWCGHSAFRLEHHDHTLYLDPFLSHNPLTPPQEKKPHKAHAVLVSHGHIDHMADAVPICTKFGAKLVCMVEASQFYSSEGVKPDQLVAMNLGGTVDVLGIQVTMVQAFHSSGIESDGNMIYGGSPVGFVLTFPSGFRMYHSGDTCVFGDMRLIAELYKPDLALLPIGGYYTMGPREAAYACKLLNVPEVLPMHFGTFPALKGTPQELEHHLKEFSASCNVLNLKPGDTIER